MDEHGLQMGATGNETILCDSNMALKQAIAKEGERFKWTTAMECISAAGERMELMVIFSGAHVYRQWLPADYDGYYMCAKWHFAATENRWTSHDIRVEWLEKCFIP